MYGNEHEHGRASSNCVCVPQLAAVCGVGVPRVLCGPGGRGEGTDLRGGGAEGTQH